MEALYCKQYGGGGDGGGKMGMSKMPSQHQLSSDNDQSSGELRALDCNLTSLCDHIQSEGFGNGSFSDVVVHAMGSTYHLHRLILSRSSYFRNMLHGPWKEANAPILTLQVDDNNVDGEAIALALAYLYGHHPNLKDNNAFRVLAAASFLDLQDLCAICTDFIISELWTSNFLVYQVFAESQDYGIHGERVRNACWGYLCQSGTLELREVLPKLSSQTLLALLTSDELWVPSEEKRFELAMYILLAKGSLSKLKHPEQDGLNHEMGRTSQPGSSKPEAERLIDGCSHDLVPSEIDRLSLNDGGSDNSHTPLVELAETSNSNEAAQKVTCSPSCVELRNHHSLCKPSYGNEARSSCSYLEMPGGGIRFGGDAVAIEGPSEESSCYQLSNNSWLEGDQRHCSVTNPSCNDLVPNDWGRCGLPLSWGGRIVGWREVKTCSKGICGLSRDDYDAFVNIFEGGSLLYCNMSFEALLNVRKQLEELGFPCKSVNDGLWLQMLLSQRVHEIGADTCKSCCLVNMLCQCRQQFGFARGVTSSAYYAQEHVQNTASSSVGNVYIADSSQSEGNGLVRPVRVHVRGSIDGLAGIGRGITFVPSTTWTPTRFVFSRVPFNIGNRNCQQSVGNDDVDSRSENNGGDTGGDGLTALVGLSQGRTNMAINAEQMERGYDTDLQTRLGGPRSSGIPMQMVVSTEQGVGIEWQSSNNSISLDMKTPLSHFPPFRFSVEFPEVHRLSDGQVKHSFEAFYAGSLWKVSVQAFSDEDPQGRRTLGLFLHRRKAEMADSLRKVHLYVDSREKVTARYQLICPSKREVMVFGSFKQTGTLLPKAPKGWGWRTALLFDELGELLQNGALRIAAVVQLI